jgi:hypothetical protein
MGVNQVMAMVVREPSQGSSGQLEFAETNADFLTYTK